MNYEALAWSIDCEGSIKITKRKNPLRYQASIQIAMCDREFPEKMKEIFNCGSIYQRKRGLNQRDLWTWVVQKQEDVKKLLINCLPHFIIKKEKAETVIAFLNFKETIEHRDESTGRFVSSFKSDVNTYEVFYQRVRNLTKDKRSTWIAVV